MTITSSGNDRVGMSGSDETLELLRSMPMLREMPDEHLVYLAGLARYQDCAEQSVIVREGEPALTIYLVVSGIVSLEVSAAGQGIKRIMTVGPGELLGWSALLNPIQWTATARALERASVLQFDGEALRRLCQEDLHFGYEFMRRIALTLSKRLNATRLQMLDVFGSMMPAIESEVSDDCAE